MLLHRGAGAIEIEREGRARHFSPVKGGISVDGGSPVALWRSSSDGVFTLQGRRVRGGIEVRRAERGLIVINAVPLEDYVTGALAGEVPASWAREALRAQAVASRTYALHERAVHGEEPYHVESSTKSQVYRGLEGREPSLEEAVEDTRCEVLTHAGAPILAAFHSASGGRTASSREVWGRHLGYLVSREVAGEDDSPDTYWRAALSRTTLSRALEAAGHRIGSVRGARILERSASGRVMRIRLEGTKGQVILTGRELRDALGERALKSTLFEVRAGEDGLVFVGSGSGHGVGMSQWGARAMAQRGMGYRQILESFYPGARLERLTGARLGSARGRSEDRAADAPGDRSGGRARSAGKSEGESERREGEERMAIRTGELR